MDDPDTPLLIEGESRAAGTLYRAFENWAGTEHVKVFFEPDTMMAVDRPDRRGFLYDEVYFITIWVAAGGDRLWEMLQEDVHDGDPQAIALKDPATEPKPERTLALVLEHGVSIDQVRDLL